MLIFALQQSDSVIHIYPFFFIFFSIMAYPRILNIVPCAVQYDLVFIRCAYFLITYFLHLPTDSMSYLGLAWLQLPFILFHSFYHKMIRAFSKCQLCGVKRNVLYSHASCWREKPHVFYSFIHSFNKDLLSFYCVLATRQRMRNLVINQAHFCCKRA